MSHHHIVPRLSTLCPFDKCNGSSDSEFVQLKVEDTPSPFSTAYNNHYVVALRLAGYADTQGVPLPFIFREVNSIQRPALAIESEHQAVFSVYLNKN